MLAPPRVIASEANAERGNLHPQQLHEIASADFVSLAMTEGGLSLPHLYLAILGILTKETWLL